MKTCLAALALFALLAPALVHAAEGTEGAGLTVEKVQQMVNEEQQKGEAKAAEGEEAVPEVKGDFEGKVTRILDASFIQIDGRRFHLAGVNVPLQTRWGKPIDCYSAESTQFLTDLIKDRTVSFSYDRLLSPRDPYGIRFVYVYVDGEMVNAKMLLEGKAFADRVRRYGQKEYFLAAEAKALRGNLGVWHSCPIECVATGCRTKTW